jgi:hypothetical protein
MPVNLENSFVCRDHVPNKMGMVSKFIQHTAETLVSSVSLSAHIIILEIQIINDSVQTLKTASVI